MGTGTLEKKIAKLPEKLKLKVEGYVDSLMAEEKLNGLLVEEFSTMKPSREPKPIFGSGKGMFGKIADDFDEPLDEMKDYM